MFLNEIIKIIPSKYFIAIGILIMVMNITYYSIKTYEITSGVYLKLDHSIGNVASICIKRDFKFCIDFEYPKNVYIFSSSLEHENFNIIEIETKE